MLAMPSGLGAPPRRRVVRSKQVQQVTITQPRSPIGQSLLVYQQRKRDAGVFPEHPRVITVTKPDGRQVRPLRPEFRLVFAQLRNMLPAENSSIVPEKRQYTRLP